MTWAACRLATLGAAGSLAIWCLIPSASAATPPVPLRQYTHSIHAIARRVDRLNAAATPEPVLDRLAAKLNQNSRVRLPDGTVIATRLFLVSAELRAGREGFIRARAALDRLEVSLRQAVPPSPTVHDRRDLHRILSGPEFQTRSNHSLIKNVASFFRRLLSFLPVRGSGSIQSTVVEALIVVAVAAFVLLAIVSIASRGASSARHHPEEETMLTTSDFEQRASEAAAEGRFRDALHWLFAAVLAARAGGSMSTGHAALTNREYLARLSQEYDNPPDPSSMAALEEMMDLFDHVWYGHEPFGGPAYDRAEYLAAAASKTVRDQAA